MIESISYVVPRIAIITVIFEPGAEPFLEWIEVRKGARRRGYSTGMLHFVAQDLGVWPQLDILAQSRVMQRIAYRLGYRLVRRSERFLACTLWLHRFATDQRGNTRTFSVVGRRTYRGQTKRSKIVYLKNEAGPPPDGGRQ